MAENERTAQTPKGPRHGLFRSVRTRLIVSFSMLFIIVLVALELATLMGIPFTGFAGRRGLQKAEAFASLNLVADLKKDRLTLWLRERRDDVHVWSDNALVRNAVADLHGAIDRLSREGNAGEALWASVQAEDSFRDLLQCFNNVADTYDGYEYIQIADAQTGMITVSTRQVDLGAYLPDPVLDINVAQRGDQYISDIARESAVAVPVLHIHSPILSEDGQVVAIWIIAIDAEEMLGPILHTGEGLGLRGEALLVNNDTQIITSLKHPLSDGTTARPLEYQIQAVPAIRAAGGEEGIIENRDYRGVAVLAAYRYIRVTPEWGWGMVVKRDRAEVMAPIYRDAAYSTILGVGAIIVIILLGSATATKIAHPISLLSKAAKQVTAGDWAARVPVTSSDDLGVLSTTFNSMVQRIQAWHESLEQQIQQRTAELGIANRGLKAEIYDRKQAEDALRHAVMQWQETFDAVPDMITIHDKNRRIIMANRATMRAFPDRQIIGAHCFQLFHGTDSPPEECPIFESLLSSRPAHFELTEPSLDDHQFDVDVYPIREEGEEPHQWVHVVRDITDRKNAERQVLERTQDLERSNAELHQFAYVASHDLQEPLRMVASYLGLLERRYKGQLDKDADEFIAFAVDGAQRMKGLIDDLLAYSRVGTHGKPFEPVSAADVLDHAIANLSVAAADASAVITHDPLPTVTADASQLLQLFQNLISNAIKFRSDKPPQIHVSAGKTGEEWTFCVQDNGIGIEAQYADRVFQVFQRLHPREEYAGSGIGLAVCKKIAQRHGGRIWLDPEPQTGAKICFSVPVNQAAQKREVVWMT